jgi:spoIIIJ-associated protein
MEQRITNIVGNLLKTAGFPEHTIAVEKTAGQTVFQIKTTDSRRFIGMRGETLQAMDYIVKKMAEKEGITNSFFIIDVEGYRSRQIKDLEQKARMMAERARSFQYDVELTPMSAYERLIIHSALAESPNIKTESRGEGRDRRVVIRYVSIAAPQNPNSPEPLL